MNLIGICTYETPCGWCTKWDKKCDRKIGYSKDNNIKSDNGLILTDIHSTIRKEN